MKNLLKNARFVLYFIFASLLVVSVARAHHGDAGRYEEGITIMTGTVIAFLFVNPHPKLILDVTEENGKTVRWQAEFSNTNRMNREFGWNRNTLKPGDKVTLTGRVNKNGAPHINLTERAQVVMTETGEQIFRARSFVSEEEALIKSP
jgi:hypothetical protein